MNPRANAANDLSSQIGKLYGDRSFDVNPMSFSEMNRLTEGILLGGRNRSLSQAGGLNTARGLSLGVTNPFSLARRAEAGVYDSFAGALSGNAGSNIDRAFGQLFQSKNAKFGRLAQLLGLQSGNIGNMSSGSWNEIIGPLLGGLTSGVGQAIGGKIV